jgi:hypothetical protein
VLHYLRRLLQVRTLLRQQRQVHVENVVRFFLALKLCFFIAFLQKNIVVNREEFHKLPQILEI